MSTTSSFSKLTLFTTGSAGVAILFFGPLISLALLPLTNWDPLMVSYAQWLLLLAWSPLLPVGVPALLLQDERDKVNGPFRALSVFLRLFVSGPARVVSASWANAAGVTLALTALVLF